MNCDLINKILSLNSKDNSYCKLLLNNKYVCHFLIPSHVKDYQTYYYFSKFVKDENSSRKNAISNIEFSLDNKFFTGQIFVHYDNDLGKNGLYTMSMYINDNNLNDTLMTITNVEIIEND